MPRVHWVTRSCTKLTMIRGENCMEASVKVISMMANTIDTTVIMEPAMPPRIICATCGSACEGNSAPGVQPPRAGKDSSNSESSAPAQPSASAIDSGRTRNPPRRLYMARRNSNGRRLGKLMANDSWRELCEFILARYRQRRHIQLNVVVECLWLQVQRRSHHFVPSNLLPRVSRFARHDTSHSALRNRHAVVNVRTLSADALHQGNVLLHVGVFATRRAHILAVRAAARADDQF